jgi:hypothetical protein
MTRFSRQRTITAALIGLAIVAAACGDDDEASSEAETAAAVSSAEGAAAEGAAAGADGSADLGAYCNTFFAIEAAFNADEPDPAEIGPLLDDIAAEHPAEVGEHVTVMVDAARQAVETGDTAGFETPEFAAAEPAAGAYNFENCPGEKGEVQAVDYAFEGIPDELPAGQTILQITNEGAEIHEMGLFRKNDGVAQPMAEILALGEEEAFELVTTAGFKFMGEPGGVAYMYADLEPGDYAAVCFLPVGATDFAALESLGEDAPPHFTQGMVREFTVAG